MLSTHKQKKLNWPGHLGQVPKNNNKGERQKTNAKTGKWHLKFMRKHGSESQAYRRFLCLSLKTYPTNGTGIKNIVMPEHLWRNRKCLVPAIFIVRYLLAIFSRSFIFPLSVFSFQFSVDDWFSLDFGLGNVENGKRAWTPSVNWVEWQKSVCSPGDGVFGIT